MASAKTFSNCFGFERGLRQHQTMRDAGVPKTSVFWRLLGYVPINERGHQRHKIV